VQQRTCSRGTGSFTVKSTAAEDGVDSADSSRNALLDTLAEDVYSYTVKCTVQGVQGCRMFKAVLAMMFTFFLQVGLLILLWRGLVHGSATHVSGDTPENDRLWRQVGQVQRQVCWLTKNAIINTTAAGDGRLNCTGAWAEGPICSAGRQSSSDPPIGYQAFKNCLEALASQPLDAWKYFTIEQACEGFKDMDSSLKAFGVGLLFPDYMPGMLHGTLCNGFWHVGAPASRDSTVTQSDLAEDLAHVAFNSYEGCLPHIPPAPAQEPLIVNLLAFLALATYVHQEMMQAAWLGYVAAACCGILPAFYITPLSRGVGCGRLGLSKQVLMLGAPLLQQVTSTAVLASSMGLTFIKETQASVVGMILGNVALSFILDLYNRVGVMLQTQATRSSSSSSISSISRCSSCCSTLTHPCEGACGVVLLACAHCPHVGAKSVACARFWGYVYLSLLGLLVLAERVCLTPTPAWTVYSILCDKLQQQTAVTEWTKKASRGMGIFTFVNSTHKGARFAPERDRETMKAVISVERYLHNITVPGQERYEGALRAVLSAFKLRVEELQFSIDIVWQGFERSVLVFVYPCLLGLFVFLLCSNSLVVTKAMRWNPVLLVVQVFLAMNVVDLPSGLVCFFLAWSGMFVLWPLLHRPPTRCCSRCCSSCRCPLCQECCPGKCCCACCSGVPGEQEHACCSSC
jgi:hypothetical protein